MALALELTLTTLSGEKTTRFPLSQQFTTIGRRFGVVIPDIQINHLCISRIHATIEKRHGHVFLHDHSMNGTWLNGMRVVSRGRGAVLRYDDVRARLPCIPTTALHPHDCMASLSCHTCLLSHSQDIEFGVAPDLERTTEHPFRARATYRVTISSCTPLGQRKPLVQMSAPIPLAADLNPNPDSSALHNSSTSEPMEPQPKRQCIDELAHASDAPLAAVEPPLAANPLVVAPRHAAEPFDASHLSISLPADLDWVVFANDPNDASGVRSVFLAEHSLGKADLMLEAAYPFLTLSRRTSLVNMPAFNVFRFKKGGGKDDAIADARTACQKIIELADKHGSALRVWGTGGGVDRIIQSSTLTGFVNPDNVRPLSFPMRPEQWEELGVRPSLNPNVDKQGCKKSINLSSVANATATYRAEIWRSGQLVTHFYIGNYPHPGSQSWGNVEMSSDYHSKFLNNLADGTPSQAHVIMFNADDFE